MIPGLSPQSDAAPNATLYVLQVLRAMNTYTATKDFEAALEWLNQWACSRSFGLGTRCATAISPDLPQLFHLTYSHQVDSAPGVVTEPRVCSAAVPLLCSRYISGECRLAPPDEQARLLVTAPQQLPHTPNRLLSMARPACRKNSPHTIMIPSRTPFLHAILSLKRHVIVFDVFKYPSN